MDKTEYLEMYTEGWVNADAETILKATAENFTFGDPNSGIISRNAFSNYIDDLKTTAASLCNNQVPKPFLDISGRLTEEKNNILVSSCWWVIPGTDMKGSGIIKVSDAGVYSEVVTYFEK